MSNINKEYLDKLSSNVIEKFSKYNKPIYDKTIKQNISNLENIVNLTNVANFFEAADKKIFIKQYEFDEYLTTISGSIFLNTLSYIKFKTNKHWSIVGKEYLSSYNKSIARILENSFYSIDESESNVIDSDAFNLLINKQKINLYTKFFDVFKNEIKTKIIPNTIETFININYSVLTENLALFKLNQTIEDSINLLTNKTLNIVKDILNEIYLICKRKPINQQHTYQNKKQRIPFSDFDNENEIFDIKFTDQTQALQILGLDEFATKQDIKIAYKKLAIKYHPDNNKSEYAEQEMKKINAAYNLLKK